MAILAGLQAGETVIVSGHENLYQGATVVAGGLLAAAAAPEMKDMPGHGAETKLAQAPAAGREGGDLRINLSPVPASPRVGDTRLRIEVKDAAGAPVPGAKVEVSAGMTGMAGPKVAARPAKEAGMYEATVNLGMAGAWTVDVVVTRPQGGTATAKFNLEAK
jgi:autotransporter-associated beta strand protein